MIPYGATYSAHSIISQHPARISGAPQFFHLPTF
jgi:hypothetical protein